MPSAFEEVARNALQELDCGELIPVGSLCQAAGFQPYSLLARKTCGSLFWKTRYKCVDLTLRDLLEPDAPEPDTVQDGPFHLHDAIDGKLKGSGELTSPAVQGRLSAEAKVSRSCSASLCVSLLSARPDAWAALQRERRLRQPEPKILQQLRRRGDNLYVVTKVLRTLGEAKVTRTLKQEGSGQMALLSAVCLKGKGEGHLSREQTVTIPEGSVLAFQPALLTIDSNWEVLLFPDKKQKTFGPPKQGFLQRAGLGLFPASGDSVQSDAAAQSYTLAEDWQGLQAEVAEQQGLCVLSGQLCEQLLHGLAELLPGEAALQRLEESLERGLSGDSVEPGDGPVGDVLECLMLSDQRLEPELAEGVLYLVGALAVLTETQRALLARGLQTRDLQEPLSLVEDILEQSSPWQLRQPVSLPARLLGSWGAGAPAWVLLEECGLELQVDAPHVIWEPEAGAQPCALYACLALLSRLSQAQ